MLIKPGYRLLGKLRNPLVQVVGAHMVYRMNPLKYDRSKNARKCITPTLSWCSHFNAFWATCLSSSVDNPNDDDIFRRRNNAWGQWNEVVCCFGFNIPDKAACNFIILDIIQIYSIRSFPAEKQVPWADRNEANHSDVLGYYRRLCCNWKTEAVRRSYALKMGVPNFCESLPGAWVVVGPSVVGITVGGTSIKMEYEKVLSEMHYFPQLTLKVMIQFL